MLWKPGRTWFAAASARLALLGFFGLLIFNGHPAPAIGAGSGVAIIVLTSSTAASHAVPPDSVIKRIGDRDERYQAAFKRSYKEQLSGARQRDIMIGAALGVAAGFGALIRLLSGT